MTILSIGTLEIKSLEFSEYQDAISEVLNWQDTCERIKEHLKKEPSFSSGERNLAEEVEEASVIGGLFIECVNSKRKKGQLSRYALSELYVCRSSEGMEGFVVVSPPGKEFKRHMIVEYLLSNPKNFGSVLDGKSFEKDKTPIKGVGSLLMQYVQKRCLEERCDFELNAAPSAEKFYEKLGCLKISDHMQSEICRMYMTYEKIADRWSKVYSQMVA